MVIGKEVTWKNKYTGAEHTGFVWDKLRDINGQDYYFVEMANHNPTIYIYLDPKEIIKIHK